METQSSGLSIASMVCGICALVFTCCIPYVPQILGILGVIFAGVSLSKHMGGKGMAIAGLVCSLIALAIYAIALITAFGKYFFAVHMVGLLSMVLAVFFCQVFLSFPS